MGVEGMLQRKHPGSIPPGLGTPAQFLNIHAQLLLLSVRSTRPIAHNRRKPARDKLDHLTQRRLTLGGLKRLQPVCQGGLNR